MLKKKRGNIWGGSGGMLPWKIWKMRLKSDETKICAIWGIPEENLKKSSTLKFILCISFLPSICIHRSIILIFKEKSMLVDFFPGKMFCFAILNFHFHENPCFCDECQALHHATKKSKDLLPERIWYESCYHTCVPLTDQDSNNAVTKPSTWDMSLFQVSPAPSYQIPVLKKKRKKKKESKWGKNQISKCTWSHTLQGHTLQFQHLRGNPDFSGRSKKCVPAPHTLPPWQTELHPCLPTGCGGTVIHNPKDYH